jgi:uncharacterized membrane protein YedE/YeeE
MHNFTPAASLIGGALIGLSASLLLLVTGRVAGISGIVARLLLGEPGDRAWRLLFLAGLLGAGLAFRVLEPAAIAASPRSLALLAASGVLVGAGTYLSHGCTSGHGVCGISRLSARSMLATVTFVLTGMLTATLVRWLGAGV